MATIRQDELPNYTYEDYCQWEGQWELIDGIPYAMTPSPTIKHQGIASKIIYLLNQQIEDCPQCMVLHEQDWKLNETTMLKPDVVLVCNESGDAYLTKRPEIVVEVISKSSIQRDEEIKFRLYANEKVPYYVIVYPDDLKAKAYRLVGEQFEKIADFSHETLNFDDLPCDAGIDFDVVFKNFRN